MSTSTRNENNSGCKGPEGIPLSLVSLYLIIHECSEGDPERIQNAELAFLRENALLMKKLEKERVADDKPNT